MAVGVDYQVVPESPPPAPLFDPLGIPFYLRFCQAIERYTADSVADDRAAFRVRGTDLRYVVERHLFFALINDRSLRGFFVAMERGDARCDVEALPKELARLVAPYLFAAKPNRIAGRKDLRARILRLVYRRLGRSIYRLQGTSERGPKVLFLVIHPKFVRYLQPIAQAMPDAVAFLTIDDPEMFQWLESQDLPRLSIELTPESRECTKPSVRLGRYEYSADPFDYLAVRFNGIRRALSELRPECIVVPEGNAAICELTNRVAKTLSIPTVCIQQGWAPFVHTGFRNMTYTRMCVWGEGFKDLLTSYNPDQRFVVTGNHAVRLRRQADAPDRRAVAFFLQKGALLMTDAVWREMLRFIRWTAASFPQKEVWLREHPSSPFSDADLAEIGNSPNIRLMPPEQASLDEVLAGCQIAVAMDSTTILEGMASGVVPLILSVNGFEHYSPDIAADGAAVDVNDFGAARTALSRLIEDDAYRLSFAGALERVSRRFFARNCDDSLAAIVAEIENLRRRRPFAGVASLFGRNRR